MKNKKGKSKGNKNGGAAKKGKRKSAGKEKNSGTKREGKNAKYYASLKGQNG
jgi:hypothetical protein